MPRLMTVLHRCILLLSLGCCLTLLPASALALPDCLNSGDANNDGSVTPADASQALQHFLGIDPLPACNATAVRPSDVLCTMEVFLGRPACLDPLILTAQEFDREGTAGDVIELPVRATQPVGRASQIGPAQANGVPVEDVPVTFAPLAGDGVFVRCDDQAFVLGDRVTVNTDANGLAVACYRLGSERLNTVEADAPGAREPVRFEIIGLVTLEAIAVENDGQLIVVDSSLRGLFRVDPSSPTGERTLLSGGQTGTGDPFSAPVDVAVDRNTGMLYVVDFFANRVVGVNPQTGNRTTVSACGEQGDGLCLDFPLDIALDNDGSLLVSNLSSAILRVDPTTGERRLVSAADRRGDGPAFRALQDIALETAGTLVGVDNILRAVVRVNLSNGDRSIVGPEPLPTCDDGDPAPCAGFILSLAVEANGSLIIASDRTLLRLNPNTGNLRELHRRNQFFPTGIAVESTGALVMSDGFFQAVTRFAPATPQGALSIISQPASIGNGFPFLDLLDLAVGRNGELFVVDSAFGFTFIVQVDPDTGTRTHVAFTPGFGLSLAVEAENTLVLGLATGQGVGALLRSDTTGGDFVIPQLFSGCFDFDADGVCDDGTLLGNGDLFGAPLALTVDRDGNLVVADNLGRITVVDPDTGDRLILSDSDIPALGPALLSPNAIAVGGDGSFLVVDNRRRAVVQVNAVSGVRTIVSGCIAFDTCDPVQGTGVPFANPQGIVVEKSGMFLVTDASLEAVLRVDPATGNRTIISGCSEFTMGVCTGKLQGTGEPFLAPAAIAVEQSGTLVVSDRELLGLVRMSADGDNRTILSRGLFGLGPHLVTPRDQVNSEGESVELFIVAVHLEDQTTTFAAEGLPPGLMINRTTGIISGDIAGNAGGECPQGSQPIAGACRYMVTVTATDGTFTDLATFVWMVIDPGVEHAPIVVNPGTQSNTERDTVRVAVLASDFDNDPLTFSVEGLPRGLQLDAGTGLITGSIALNAVERCPQPGADENVCDHTVRVTVADGNTMTSVTFTWTVRQFVEDHGDDIASATGVDLGERVLGVLGFENDVDVFCFELVTASQVIVTTTGDTDTFGQLLDAQGNLFEDDDEGAGLNFLFPRFLPAGVNCVAVSGFAGIVTGPYTLVVTLDDHGETVDKATPIGVPSMTEGQFEAGNDFDLFCFSLGVETDVHITTEGNTDTFGTLTDSQGNTFEDDDSGTNLNFLLSLPLLPGPYCVQVRGFDEFVTGSYTLIVTPDDHGNSFDTATSIPRPLPSTTSGVLEVGNEFDVFRFVLDTDSSVHITTEGDTDTFGVVFDSAGVIIFADDDSGAGFNFLVSERLPAGTYFVAVFGFDEFVTGPYTLIIALDGSNQAPTADAGVDQTIDEGIEVILNGSASSDPEDAPNQLTFAWTQEAGPAVTLTRADRARPTFTAPSVGGRANGTVLRFALQVTDSGGLSALDTVRVTVNDIDPPSAVACCAQTVGEGDPVTLDGSGSSDPDDDQPLDFTWTQVPGQGPAVNLLRPNSANPTFTAPAVDAEETLQFRLRVTDPGGLSDTATVSIHIRNDDHGNTLTTATLIDTNSSTAGALDAGDVDVFRVELSTASFVLITTEGDIADTFGTLLDNMGNPVEVDGLPVTDDDGGAGLNFLLAVFLPAGTYFVEVRGFDETVSGAYTLLVTLDDHGETVSTATEVNVPSNTAGRLEVGNDFDAFRFHLSEPGFVTITSTGTTDTLGSLLDANGNFVFVNDDSSDSLNFRLIEYRPAGDSFVLVGAFSESDTGDYTLQVRPGVTADHGDTPATATGIALDVLFIGAELEVPGDVDVFHFELLEPTTVVIETGGGTDTFGRLFDVDGPIPGVEDDDSGPGLNFRIQRTLSAGLYFIEVSGFLDSFGSYDIRVSR